MARKKPSREEFERVVAERQENIRQLRERIARMKTEHEEEQRARQESPRRRRLFGLR